MILKHYNIIVNKNNHIQKGQIQIEGDLNFQNKNNKPSNVNQGKNVGHNAFELMSHNQNFKRMGNFTSNAKKKLIIEYQENLLFQFLKIINI